MGRLTVYNNKYTSGYDNGPGSEDDSSDSNASLVSDTRDSYWRKGVVTIEWMENGNTHRGSVLYDYITSFSAPVDLGLYVTQMSHSINGSTESILSGFYLKPDLLELYTGDAFLEYVYGEDDVLSGANGADILWGYSGNDTIYGNSGGDTLNGGLGNDTLYGDSGNDYLYGDRFHDTLYGGSGDDHLDGGWGRDVHYGGSGYDHVHYMDKSFDYVLSKSPITNIITTTYENGYDKGTVHSDVEEIQFQGGVKIKTDTVTYKGSFGDVKSGAVSPIYRFYNNRDEAYFYTASGDEKDMVITNSSYDRPDSIEWPYVYQGSTFEAAHSYLSSDALVPLYRFYNTDTGHHFFTASKDEADMVKAKAASGEWPFNYEGTAFNVYSSDPNPSSSGEELAIHRFYSPSLNRHFFTGDLTEVENMKLTGIWDYEGVGFFGEILG